MNITSQLHRRAVAINRIYCRTFAVPGQKGEKVPKGGKAGKKDSTGERKLLDNMYLLATASEKAKKYKPRFPVEVAKEHARIAAEYNRQTTILHNKRNKDLQTKCYLQHEAMECLKAISLQHGGSTEGSAAVVATSADGEAPAPIPVGELYALAMKTDPTPPPPDRPFPTWDTPPVKDFDVKEYLKKEAADNVGTDTSSDLV